MDAGASSSSTFSERSDSMSVDDSEKFALPKRLKLAKCMPRERPGSGRFKNAPFIVASSKAEYFAYFRLCSPDFSVAHGGHMTLNITVKARGINSDSQSNSTMTRFLGESSMSHSSKVISAEVMMAQFIALHNLPFQAADHLSDLVSSMFPDSRIAADTSSKHTKTQSIICNALDPYLKEPVADLLKCAPFNLM